MDFLNGGIRVLQKWDVISVSTLSAEWSGLRRGGHDPGRDLGEFLARSGRLAFTIASRATIIAGATVVIGTLTCHSVRRSRLNAE
jgi:hypothetical protein